VEVKEGRVLGCGKWPAGRGQVGCAGRPGYLPGGGVDPSGVRGEGEKELDRARAVGRGSGSARRGVGELSFQLRRWWSTDDKAVTVGDGSAHPS
jgi:hypothetical protein